VTELPPVLTFGETMGLATSSRPGSFMMDSALELGIGGAETNVAIGLARLGVGTTWVSRLGDDGLGRLILREMHAEQVDVRVTIDATAPTGFMLKERRTRARSSVTYYRAGSAAAKLSVEDLPSELLHGRALLHLTGITPALSPSAREATLHAARAAHALGVPVSFDLNYRSRLWTPAAAAPVFAQLVALSSVVFAGLDEAQLLFPGIDDPLSLARAFVQAGAADAVIKLGDAGCVAVISGSEYEVPAVRVDPVDTVGAGDAFVAGYLSQLVRGAEPSERLARAVLTGALACLVPGDWEGAPRDDELAAFERAETVLR
jgi:2-dehydro-3-deoxygluconokinase